MTDDADDSEAAEKQPPTSKTALEPHEVSAGYSVEDRPPDTSQVTITSSLEAYQGPIPHPAILRQFEQIVPGSAKQLFNILEREGKHRHAVEMRKVAIEESSQMVVKDWVKFRMGMQSRGQIGGFALAFTGLLGGGYLVSAGHNEIGVAAMLTSLATIVVAFVAGQRFQRQNPVDDQELSTTESVPEPPAEGS